MATPVVTTKTYKEKAVIGGVTVWQNSGNSIEISDTNYPSVKAGLRALSEKAGFKYDPDWTVQQLGKKLIAFVNDK